MKPHEPKHEEEQKARCPTCRRPVPRGAQDAPFCSPRCRLIDLSRWLSGDYAIPGDEPLPDEAPEDDV